MSGWHDDYDTPNPNLYDISPGVMYEDAREWALQHDSYIPRAQGNKSCVECGVTFTAARHSPFCLHCE